MRDEYLTYFGSNITLTCQITGTPKPTGVYWEKRVNNGSKLITSETAGIRGCSLEVPSLTILYATTVDTGMYTCHAVNPVGVGRSLQIQLKVEGGRFTKLLKFLFNFKPVLSQEYDSCDINSCIE